MHTTLKEDQRFPGLGDGFDLGRRHHSSSSRTTLDRRRGVYVQARTSPSLACRESVSQWVSGDNISMQVVSEWVVLTDSPDRPTHRSIRGWLCLDLLFVSYSYSSIAYKLYVREGCISRLRCAVLDGMFQRITWNLSIEYCRRWGWPCVKFVKTSITC